MPSKAHALNTKRNPTTSILICQIMSFDESKIYKFTTAQSDMILNYDFYQDNDKFKIVSWTQNQNLCQQSIDLVKLAPKELDKSTIMQMSKFDEDVGALKSSQSNPTSVLQIPANTTNSSRKSSISLEYGYGTPPTTLTSILNNRMGSERESINLNDLVGHDFLKKNPKCFGAKFGGLANHFIIFSNEEIAPNSTKTNSHSEGLQFTKRMRSNSKSKGSAKTMYKHVAKRTQSKVYVYDISFLLAISRELAEEYFISDMNLNVLCEKNMAVAVGLKRFDIVKIWELIKFVTYNNIEEFSLNPDDGRPWSCSVFGRPLVSSM